MAQESRVNGSQVNKLIFSYGYLFVGILVILGFSPPSHSNLLSGIDSLDDGAQSGAQEATPEVALEMTIQPTGQGSVYDSEDDSSHGQRLFGTRARYSYTTKTAGLTIASPSGVGGWSGQFSSDEDDGNDGNDGNDGDGADDPFGDIIIPEEVVQGSVADASDLLTEVNFKNYRYGRLLNSL